MAWTPALLLLTPFVVFARHHVYALYQPEILGCLLLLGAVGALLAWLAGRWPSLAGTLTAGCLVLFADLQFDFEVPIEGIGETAVLLASLVVLAASLTWLGGRVISVIGLMTAAVLATTMVLPGGRLTFDESRVVDGAGQGPFVLHLILDEHIGPAGLRAAGHEDAAAQLQAFLETEGFLVFDAAYSQTAETIQSIGHILDLRPGHFDPDLVVPTTVHSTSRLARSRYLSGFSERGYTIRVFQSDHLDLCSTGAPVEACHTYASTKLGILQQTSLSPVNRALVVAGAYLMRSDIWNEVREQYNSVQERRPGTLPPWTWEQNRVSTVAAALALDRLEADLRRARRGQVVLAHMLFPHFPYSYDAACDVLPPLEWMERNDTHFWPHGNTPEGRAVRYEQYVGQLACAGRRLERLLAAIPDAVRKDAVVVVHGDHGSRISIGGPSAPRSDAVDVFSTLFAVRSPGIPPGRDDRQSAIACLLAELTARDFSGRLPGEACSTPPAVMSGTGDERLPQPLPRFE